MRTFVMDEFSDLELSEMLAFWVAPEPPAGLKARVFARAQGFQFPSFEADEEPWYKWLFSKPRAASVVAHAGVVALLLAMFQSPVIQKIRMSATPIYLPNWHPKGFAVRSDGGGGGGEKTSAPVSQGAAPKAAFKQFLPPEEAMPRPKLPVVPTITAPAPIINADAYGDPLSKVLEASGGKGFNGLGSGSGGGVGAGNGSGYGPGWGGGTGGGVFQIGGDVSQPIPIYKVEPEYSEAARKAKYSGTVLLSVIIDANGNPHSIRVIRPLGLGLDEKAIEAVAKWRFRPALRGGKPVAVEAMIEVNFRLL